MIFLVDVRRPLVRLVKANAERPMLNSSADRTPASLKVRSTTRTTEGRPQRSKMAVPTIQDPSPTTNGVSGAAAKEATNGHTSELTMTSPVNEMPHSTQVYKTNGTSSYGRSASRLSSGSGLASPLHGRSARHTNGDSYTVYVVEKHTATLHKRCMMELGASKAQGIFSTSYATFIEWIRTERLTTLPHKSGRWDKVLIWAQHFAERFNAFNGAVRAFVSDSDNAARLMFGCCLLLLEVMLCILFGLVYYHLPCNSSDSKMQRLLRRPSDSSTTAQWTSRSF